MQEESGTWDRITEPVSSAWKWAEEKISAAKEWAKETVSAVWDGNEEILALLTSVVFVVGHFFKGFGQVLVDTVTGIWNFLTHPIDSFTSTLHAISHPVETGKAIWQAISQSWTRDVVNGDANSRAEWFGYAAGEIALAVVGTREQIKLQNGPEEAKPYKGDAAA